MKLWVRGDCRNPLQRQYKRISLIQDCEKKATHTVIPFCNHVMNTIGRIVKVATTREKRNVSCSTLISQEWSNNSQEKAP